MIITELSPLASPHRTTIKKTKTINHISVQRGSGFCQQSGHGMDWNGRRFFHIPNWQFSSILFPFHTKNLPFHIPFHTKIFFHIPFHTKIFFHVPFHTSIPKKKFDWKQCKACFASLQCCKQPLVKVHVTIQRCSNQYLVCTLHMV